MTKKIVTLTGHKYCGKVSVAMRLTRNSDIKLIYPITDRKVPPHQKEMDMDEYIHVTKERLDQMIEEDKLLSQTVIDGDRFCFFESQLTAPYNLMIVDDYALMQTKDNYGGEVYTIKVRGEWEVKSDRVDEYLYDHEFDEVFHYKVDDIEELEWRIGYEFD